MTTLNRRNNRNRQQGRTNNLGRQLALLKSSLHGHKNHLRSTNPPPFTTKPYNSLTVGLMLPDASGFEGQLPIFGSLDVNALIKATCLQLYDATTPLPVVKLSRVDLWAIPKAANTQEPNITFNPVPSIRMKAYSLTPSVGRNASQELLGDQCPLKTLTDIGMPGNSAAVVSYTYPRDQADVAHSDITGSFDIIKYHNGVDNEVHARFHIHWSTAEPLEKSFSAGDILFPATCSDVAEPNRASENSKTPELNRKN
jgi:hypothetical protein|eukprot:102162_1